MPTNRNALIRYTTIDKCLRNQFRRWTIDDLIEQCSEALYEYEGIDKGVSRRTIQLDIQNMRSEKLGYNAPIIVVDRKYYTYDDPSYSITNLPLAEQDLAKLNDAVEILKQFRAFDQFKEMSSLITKLENKLYTEQSKQPPIIHIDKNEHLKGLEFINPLYSAIQQMQVIRIEYQSYKAKRSSFVYLHPYLLKEYNNRWFIVGAQHKGEHILTLALDRIITIQLALEIKFVKKTSFDPDRYYQDVIGVTVNKGMYARKIIIKIDKTNAPYVLTKPIHRSQKVIDKDDKYTTLELSLIPNYEFERLLLGFGPSLEVVSPPSLRNRIAQLLNSAANHYK